MKLGFVHEDGAGGVNYTWCDVGEHNMHEHNGFRAAIEEGCAAVGWDRSSEWHFCFPAFEVHLGPSLILCKPEGGTPVLPGFIGW
jgi:hypothetical protein